MILACPLAVVNSQLTAGLCVNARPGPMSLTAPGTRLPSDRGECLRCGHLGAVHAACMADIGHEVLGVDIDEGKTEMLSSGKA